ncbi:MAG: hypothetical protein U1A24_16570 [Cypionkella sp.]|uniref:hypothetical protein n=1 Tax=Cypionkella sp. TaxID=2811411 RepID=UPI002AB8CB24|nr:hypothetical protein [Cypionkella sp.]MDZ4312164.1 hypothetical protein [Cypionkella sp.]MDZ4392080.1 hypothetical protein [Cypionkella sp.]
MSDQYRPPESNVPVTKSSNIGFIVGGLVVAVALLLWFVFGDRATTAADNNGTTNSVTVETPAPADPVAPAPADPVTPAPADPIAPAPADPVTPSPADPVTPAPADPAPATPPAAPANP